MQNRFFAMLARMKLIRRWGLMFSTRDENLSEHSLDTAFFMHALLSLHNRRFLAPGEDPLDLGTGVLLAIYHDAAEILTGDLPTPVKYFSAEISEAYKAVEAASCQSLLDLLPADLREDYAPYLLPAGAYTRYLPYLKAADRFSALVKCMEETRQGNFEFRRAAAQTREAISAMALPEADCFLRDFIPAFEKTLDELQTQEDF